MEQEGGTTPGKEGKVVCPVCGQEFDTQEAHDKHHKEAHPEA
ncbi:MAG: hypothetical protein WEC37_02740 [Anaerolineales bacterium]